MTDLFNSQPHPEDIYRDLHIADFAATNAALIEKGEFGPWVECDSLLTKDQLRLLRLVEWNFGYYMRDSIVIDRGVSDLPTLGQQPEQRMTSQLAVDAGFLSDVNLKHTLNTCLREGWLSESWSREHNCPKLELTSKGRWVIDVVEADEIWESMED